MLLTLFLTLIFCVAITIMLLSAVAFVQNTAFFSSAPKEAKAILKQKEHELFYGAHVIGWVLMVFSLLMIIGVFGIAVWDGVRSDFTFLQFFLRFVTILTVYKIYDMVCFDYGLLMKYHFFQYYYPEVSAVYPLKKYGYNLISQLLKLIVIFPAASALAAWLCTLLVSFF